MSELRQDWRVLRLGDCVLKLVDGSHAPPSKVNNGRPMLSARNIEGGEVIFDIFRLISDADFEQENARTRIMAGDVLLTIVGTLGRSAVVTNKYSQFTLQRSVAVITPKKELDSQFLRYQFCTTDFQAWMNQVAKGTAQKGVYLKALADASIAFPPLDEQRRIVAKLDSVLGSSRRAREELAHLPRLVERYKQAVLTKAFNGELTADWREMNISDWADFHLTAFQKEVEKNKTLLRGSRIALSDLKSEEQIFELLPNSWKYARLIDLAEIKVGFAFKSSNFKKSGVPLVRGVNVAPGKLLWDDTTYLDSDEIGLYSDYIIQENDILLAMDRPLISSGLKVAVAKSNEVPALLVQRVTRSRPKKWTNVGYIWSAINSHIFINNSCYRTDFG